MGSTLGHSTHIDQRLSWKEKDHAQHRTPYYAQNGARFRTPDVDTESGSVWACAEYDTRWRSSKSVVVEES